MLIIRPEQVEALALAAARATARERAREWAAPFAEIADRGEPFLADLAENATVRAWQYGLRGAADLRAFVQLAFGVSPRFDDHPRFRALLENSAIPPSERLETLFATATAEDWAEAAAHE